MGTIGSGRRYRPEEVKPLVESAVCLDLSRMKKQGDCKPGSRFEITYSTDCNEIMTVKITMWDGSLTARYYSNGRSQNQKIAIVAIPCFQWYYREYLVCPDCGTHRNELYLGSNGKFACRACHGLAYRVQRLNPHQRHAYHADRLRRDKLKLPENSPQDVFTRPKSMRDKTYYRIINQITRHQKKSHELFLDYFKNVVDKFNSQCAAGSAKNQA